MAQPNIVQQYVQSIRRGQRSDTMNTRKARKLRIWQLRAMRCSGCSTNNGGVKMKSSTCPMPHLVGLAVSAAMCATSAVADQDLSGPRAAAAKPVFSLKGGKYEFVQTVSIGDKTIGASIYYTTDGTTPSLSSTPYTGPVAVAASATLKAIALGPDDVLSGVKTGTYTIN